MLLKVPNRRLLSLSTIDLIEGEEDLGEELEKKEKSIMSNPSSLLRTPLSPKMVNRNPLRFLTPPTEPSSSTPMCGIREIGESIMPQTEVVDQSLVNPV
ncbi:hypothetical protein H5410_050766 [Solanum commersonii]|uniref:Uncharacterized protein n=1 Tax=Solanum commersonii TaxID=4109 RepID=A0A9J5WWG2_SOLCO|nr:hypothetical protein H5410_050766 [Solanum commersonii]